MILNMLCHLASDYKNVLQKKLYKGHTRAGTLIDKAKGKEESEGY